MLIKKIKLLKFQYFVFLGSFFELQRNNKITFVKIDFTINIFVLFAAFLIFPM